MNWTAPGMEQTPAWVTYFYYAGIVGAALASLLPLSRRFRSWWQATFWGRFRRQFVTKAELAAHHAEQFTQILLEAKETRALCEVMVKSQHALQAIVTQQGARVDELIARLELIDGKARVAADRDETIGMIECDAHGHVTFISRSVVRWMQASRHDLLGQRWLNYVAPEDREPIRREIELVKREHRELRMQFRMGPDSTDMRSYSLSLHPVPENPPARAWSGWLRPITHNEKLQ